MAGSDPMTPSSPGVKLTYDDFVQFPDETIKRRLYDRTGVSEYWIVDPEIDTIRVYRREAKTFARVVELSAEPRDVLTTSLLPGLEIPLSRVFRA
jgi:Uma2 family endonuclease